MALITICTSCKTRMSGPEERCKKCDSVDLSYMVVYRPTGRNGKLIRHHLPPNINNVQKAIQAEELFKNSIKKRKKTIEARPKGSTVNDLFPLYLSKHSTLYHREATYKDVNACYDIHYKPIIGHLDVTATDDMELFIKYRKAEGVKNRTINKELYYYAGFRKWCYKNYKIPLPEEKTLPLPAKRPKPIVLSLEDVVRIFYGSEPFYRAYYLAFYSIGLRQHEAQEIRRKDIDFDNRILRVEQKGGSYKLLPLSDWFIESLIDMGAQNLPPDVYIFLNPKTNKPIKYVRKALARACRKGGVDRHVNPHLFRHSIATWLVGQGVNLRLIQEMLGHSSIKTTEFYTHISVDHLRETQKVVQQGYDKIRNKIKKMVNDKNKAEKMNTKKVKILKRCTH
ncbi:MAG: tyrosine-type recombinase/integrase [Phycisphaerales bacterium]